MKYFAVRVVSLGTLFSLASVLVACSNRNSASTPSGAAAMAPNEFASAPVAATQPTLKLNLLEPVLPAAAVPAGPAKRPYNIGVSLLTRDDEFYKSLEQGLKDEAARQKVDHGLTIVSADKDLNKQINQVQNFIAQKVDAIVLCPVDSLGIATAVIAANQANIPVFTADIAAKGGKIVAHIASDNVEGGRQDGEFLGKLLKGKGNVAILDLRTVTSVQDRVKGFRDALRAYPGIKIVADEDVDGAKRENAVPKATNVLTAHQDINAIFGINDPVALGTLSALQQLNRTDVAVIGFDAVPEAQSRIAAGSQLKADAIQWPHVIGGATIDAVVKSLNGEPVPAIIPISTGIVTRDSFAKK